MTPFWRGLLWSAMAGVIIGAIAKLLLDFLHAP